MNANPIRPRGLATTLAAIGMAGGLLATAAPAHAVTGFPASAITNVYQRRKPLRRINFDVAVPGNLAEVKGLQQGDDAPGYRAKLVCYDLSFNDVVLLSGPLVVSRIDNGLFSKVVHLNLPGIYRNGDLLGGCTVEVILPDHRAPSVVRAAFYGGLFGLSKTIDFNAQYVVKAA